MTVGVLAAETVERAEYLAAPARLAVLALRTGRGSSVSPQDAAVHPRSRYHDRGGVQPGRRDADLVAERLT